MRRFITNTLAASLLLFATATFAQDRTDMDSNRDTTAPAVRVDRPATTPAPNNTTTADDDSFNPGWFGLVGLIGLLGLMPRDNVRDRFDRTHPAGTTTGVHHS